MELFIKNIRLISVTKKNGTIFKIALEEKIICGIMLSERQAILVTEFTDSA